MAKTLRMINEKALAKVLKKADAVYICKTDGRVNVSDGRFIAQFKPEPGGVMDTLIYSLFGPLAEGYGKKRDKNGVTDFDAAEKFDTMIDDVKLMDADDTKISVDLGDGKNVHLFEAGGFVAINTDYYKLYNPGFGSIHFDTRHEGKRRPVLFLDGVSALYIMPITYHDTAAWVSYLNPTELLTVKKSA